MTGRKGKFIWIGGIGNNDAQKENSLLSKVPLFEDDEEVLPILGADLYAWLLSKNYNSLLVGEEIEALNLLHQRETLGLIVNQEVVKKGLQK